MVCNEMGQEMNVGLSIPFFGIKRQYNNLRTEILDATDVVLRSGQVMSGNFTVEFENWLAKRNKVEYAITCHSGTHALEIIAEYFKTWISINPPKVLLPAMSFAATANAFVRTGWEIEFIDVDVHGQMCYEKIDRKKSIQALCIVGLYGQAVTDQPYYYTDIVIEDGAQHWLANNCRRWGNACAISFDPMKNLNSYGNGGAIVTDDLDLLEFAREWTNNGKPNEKLKKVSIHGERCSIEEVSCKMLMQITI